MSESKRMPRRPSQSVSAESRTANINPPTYPRPLFSEHPGYKGDSSGNTTISTSSTNWAIDLRAPKASRNQETTPEAGSHINIKEVPLVRTLEVLRSAMGV